MDPDPQGSVLIWLSRIRIRIGNADPDSGASKPGCLSKRFRTFFGIFFNLFSAEITCLVKIKLL